MTQIYLNGLKLVILTKREEFERILKELEQTFEVEIEYRGECG